MASSIWKGYVTFGLVSFPVKLTAAARSETISFNQLHKHDHSRVKQVLYCQAEDKPIPRTEIVKGYEYEKGRWVVVDDDDIKKMAPKSARVMEILEFVKASEVDPIYLESSYYLQPDEAGEKPYTVLLEALRRSGYVSVAKLTMHSREHIVLIRPGRHGMTLHTLYYQDEVRATDEFRADTTQVKEKELELATKLVETLAAAFEPEKYKDTYRENLRTMIDAKIQGAEVVEPAAEPAAAPVIDIMEALKASLAKIKKPAGHATEVVAINEGQKEQPAAPKGRKRRTATG